MMKNGLVDLQNHIMESIEYLSDRSVKGDKLKEEIERSTAICNAAKVAIQNGFLMVKAADTLYGLPVSDELPLIPKSPAEKPVILDGKRKALLELPSPGKKK